LVFHELEAMETLSRHLLLVRIITFQVIHIVIVHEILIKRFYCLVPVIIHESPIGRVHWSAFLMVLVGFTRWVSLEELLSHFIVVSLVCVGVLVIIDELDLIQDQRFHGRPFLVEAAFSVKALPSGIKQRFS